MLLSCQLTKWTARKTACFFCHVRHWLPHNSSDSTVWKHWKLRVVKLLGANINMWDEISLRISYSLLPSSTLYHLYLTESNIWSSFSHLFPRSTMRSTARMNETPFLDDHRQWTWGCWFIIQIQFEIHPEIQIQRNPKKSKKIQRNHVLAVNQSQE